MEDNKEIINPEKIALEFISSNNLVKCSKIFYFSRKDGKQFDNKKISRDVKTKYIELLLRKIKLELEYNIKVEVTNELPERWINMLLDGNSFYYKPGIITIYLKNKI